MKKILILFVIALFVLSCKTKKEEWIRLFNGKDLTGWDIKIKGFPLNVNYKNTFRVEDGVMKVNYDEYEKFNNEFGHIFYKEPFSSYKLRIEYRFTGDQVPGGPSWAFRNSGVMLHSQSAVSMNLEQDFPVSIEAQFLGGDLPEGFPLAEGTLLKDGYICLQAESHPVEFRKVEVLKLEDKR